MGTVKDKEYSVRQGESVASSHPVVKGREELFTDHDPHEPKAAA